MEEDLRYVESAVDLRTKYAKEYNAVPLYIVVYFVCFVCHVECSMIEERRTSSWYLPVWVKHSTPSTGFPSR